MQDSIEAGQLDMETMYREYGPMVLRRCRQLLRDGEAAADAMQETFVRVLRNRATLRMRYPSSLLYRIATNVCLNLLRGNRRHPVVSAESVLAGIEGRDQVEDRVMDTFLVEQVFSGARKGTRRAAELLFLEGRTLAETAGEVDLSISGVRKRIRTLREHNVALMEV